MSWATADVNEIKQQINNLIFIFKLVVNSHIDRMMIQSLRETNQKNFTVSLLKDQYCLITGHCEPVTSTILSSTITKILSSFLGRIFASPVNIPNAGNSPEHSPK